MPQDSCTETLTFKVGQQEAERIRKAAKEAGLTVSTYLRLLVAGVRLNGPRVIMEERHD